YDHLGRLSFEFLDLDKLLNFGAPAPSKTKNKKGAGRACYALRLTPTVAFCDCFARSTSLALVTDKI
ncbi:hypothetical protein, partial [Leptospira interrogans]|uniref:hypothetical protein n=1 Tax=Leptospira interrogans TaxID=173 RepID=UPI0002BD8E6B